MAAQKVDSSLWKVCWMNRKLTEFDGSSPWHTKLTEVPLAAPKFDGS